MLMTFSAPAKLNLFLHILSRRADGYHEIQTVFQYLDFSDTLKFQLRQDAEIHLHTDLSFPQESNLIWKAAKLLQAVSQSRLGVDIYLKKRIPMGSGLGGGSSDAATTLRVLNRLWEIDLSLEALAAIGEKLGADVTFFVCGYASWAEGIGTQLTPIVLDEPWYVVLIPDCHISSAEFYAHPELTRDTQPIKIDALFSLAHNAKLSNDLKNDFEPLVKRLYPQISEALKWLSQFVQERNARLTGSGGAVFATFPDQSAAQRVLDQKPDTLKGWLAKGMNCSPLLSELDSIPSLWGVAKR